MATFTKNKNNTRLILTSSDQPGPCHTTWLLSIWKDNTLEQHKHLVTKCLKNEYLRFPNLPSAYSKKSR